MSMTSARGNGGGVPAEKTRGRGVAVRADPAVPLCGGGAARGKDGMAALSAPEAGRRRVLVPVNAGRTGSVLCTERGRRGGDFVGEDGVLLSEARLPAASHSRRQRVASPLVC